MANLIAIRLYGSTSETAVTLVDEATLPRTISGLAAGDYEVGRTRIRWSGQKTTVYGPPPTPELLPLTFVATDARAQGVTVLTFTRPWAATPGAISIVSQNPANAFQMNADGVTLEYGPTMLDYTQTQIVALTLRYSDANGGPYDFSVSATVRQSNAPVGGVIALDYDVAPDMTAPVVTLSAAIVTATTVNVPVSLSEATGTLYYLNDAAASVPSATIIASGVSRAITASGAQAHIALTGLTAGTTARIHAVHRDQAGNISAPVSVSYTTTAAPTGLTGVDAAVTLWNKSDNTAGPFSGSINAVAGELICVHIWAWTGAGGQTPSTQWTVQIDGVTVLPDIETVNTGQSMAGAAYHAVAASTGAIPVTLSLGGAGRGSIAHGWHVGGFDVALPIQSTGNNASFAADVTGLSVPIDFTPAKNGNAFLSSIMIKGADQSGSVGVTGASGFFALGSGASDTSDLTSARAWGIIDPAAPVTFAYSWLTAKRCAGLRQEIRVA